MKLLASVAVAMICLASHSGHAADVKLSGSAFYRERIALPPDAALLVELMDLAKPDIALGATMVVPAGLVPIAFGLVVDSGNFSKEKSYVLQARIKVDGSTWFANAEPIPVDPTKVGEPFSILLVQARSEDATEASGVSLAGTAWRVLELDGRSADPNVTSTLIFGPDGAVSGNGGCNTFRGDVAVVGATMKFGQMASTMMACEDAKSAQEALFHEALAQTVTHLVRGGKLTLVDASGKAVARLGEP